MALSGAGDTAKEERQERRKRKRWGERPPPPIENAAAAALLLPSSSQTLATVENSNNDISRNDDPKAKAVLAMHESIRARLAAAKQLAQQNQQMPPPPAKRAKVYELDLTVTAPTFQEENQTHKESAAAADSVSTTVIGSKMASSRQPPKASTITTTKPHIPANPYLAHQYDNVNDEESNNPNDADADTNFVQDQPRASKLRHRHKAFRFVEPGTYRDIAETKRAREVKAVASGYTSGRKVGHTIQAPTLADIYAPTTAAAASTPGDGSAAAAHNEDEEDSAWIATTTPRADAHYDTKMPMAMEWWDMELLPSKLKKLVAAVESQGLPKTTAAAATAVRSEPPTPSVSSENIPSETQAADDDTAMNVEENDKKDDEDKEIQTLRQRCFVQASLSYSKTADLVQHIVPIKPPNADIAPKKQAVLHLTKKEMKRQRKLRRQDKQRELQDLQAAGLIPAPEPRLTLRNFIQVLGDQAFVDPSKIEQKVQEQMGARQQSHLERNAANKLSKEQRSAKRARKYAEDTTTSVTTAVFYVKDMSHPYHRTKLDLNAQQMNLTGCVLECSQDPSLACIVVEGGPKAIKRYTRLLLVRMKWTGLDNDNDEDEDDEMEEPDDKEAFATHKFNPENKCEFVWQGMVVKRLFHGFLFQSCETHDQARKILKAKGALHYWDQVLQHARGQAGHFRLKFTDDGDG